MAKCLLNPISTPPPKAMANAFELSRGAEIPPRMGTLTPADKLACCSPNSACPKTEVLPKYTVAVGPNRKLYKCCCVPAENPRKETPFNIRELPLKSAVTPKWGTKLNVPWASQPLKLVLPRLPKLPKLPKPLPRLLLLCSREYPPKTVPRVDTLSLFWARVMIGRHKKTHIEIANLRILSLLNGRVL